jgi:uncharacterized protein YjlB
MKVESLLLSAHDWVPNNQRLPVLIYHGAFADDGCEATASAFEEAFRLHGWPARWRDGVFDYHHYHSTAHEALGVAAGTATLIIGGPGGREIDVRAGDALVLPVGTGHCCQTASDDFLVIGAYPGGQDWDICREAPSDAARRRIATMPAPRSDPIIGADGPLVEKWR